jgi:uncharacterized membrane protein
MSSATRNPILEDASPDSAGSQAAGRLDAWICQSARWLSDRVQQFQVPILVLLSILYFLYTCDQASRRPLWYDEDFTYRISQIPGVSELWAALREGVDLNPPGYYLITRTFLALFGTSLFVARLPAVLGFWVMCMCLYRFVSVRTSALYGLAAMLLVLSTWVCQQFAIEARPYGVVLACCGLALVCWQEATAGAGRGPW